ncbi:hypothetical protein FRX31_025735 [Thalictrum thalictroides]|uniref:Uncharacterized protein n=1 Tax=Thalictrum thalictroides TaxID=46969 RepID=A0A7J6VJC5_THATH|nr:hypothetical protein FRX31_025735 [Thalictrum thalictroides]
MLEPYMIYREPTTSNLAGLHLIHSDDLHGGLERLNYLRMLLLNNVGIPHCPRTKRRGGLLQLEKAMPTFIFVNCLRLHQDYENDIIPSYR